MYSWFEQKWIHSGYCYLLWNFKDRDKQFKLKKSFIKDKLYEITKGFKEFMFQQNLQVEFSKDEKTFKKLYL